MSKVTTFALLALSVGATHAFAGPITVYFGSPNFIWNRSSAPSTANHIFTVNDFWEQTFTGTGLASATTATLHLYYDDNILLAGNMVNIDAFINGTTVGSFSIGSGDLGFHTYAFTFAGISGPDYDIKLLETNTVPIQHGSPSLSASGTSSNVVLDTVVFTPEPATLGMLAAGLALLLAGRRSRR